MARCINRNAPEYAPLLKKYKSVITVDSIINKWQDFNFGTDLFPTVAQAEEYLNNKKAAYSLKQREFDEALVANLRKLGLVQRRNVNGQLTIFVQNTPKEGAPYIFRAEKGQLLNNEQSKKVADENFNKILKYLQVHGMPLDYFIPTYTKRTIRLDVNPSAVKPKDIIEIAKKATRKISPNTTAILEHLGQMFPQLSIDVVNKEQARRYWESLPQAIRGLNKNKFDQVNSFYYRGNVILIEGRINSETAIEEVLHPFMDAVYAQNKTLFEGLLAEAKENFPELVVKIENAYKTSDDVFFDQTQIDKEIVTQALSRHFNREYENKPTESWTTMIKDLFDFFMTILKDLHKYISGKNLKGVRVESIVGFATLSDIAKLLNTSNISFDLSLANKDKVNKVQYSLSPAKTAIIQAAIDKGNELQKKIVAQLFHTPGNAPMNKDSAFTDEDGNYDFLTATGVQDGETIIVLNEKDHVYYDVKTGEKYTSATTVVKGTMPESVRKDKRIALELGNDFDAITDGIAAGLTLDQIKDNMTVLDPEVVRDAYNQIYAQINDIELEPSKVGQKGRNIVLPQVILYDEKTKTAGTVDLMVITPTGQIRIVDLKTSKNSINKIDRFSKSPTYSTNSFPLGEDSKLLYETEDGQYLLDSKGNKIRKTELSGKRKGLPLRINMTTKQQHDMQVNLYRRMAENMGLDVEHGKLGTQTYHIHVPWTEKDFNEDGKYIGTFRIEGFQVQQDQQNEIYVDQLIPEDRNSWSAEKMQRTVEKDENSTLKNGYLDDNEAMSEDITDANGLTEYNTIFTALQDFKQGLLDRKTALLQLRSAITLDKTRAEAVEMIDDKIAAIEVATLIGDGKKMAAEYTKLLTSSIKEMDKFIEYMNDPKNYNSQKYINYALNFDKFIATYSGLRNIKKSGDLNNSQMKLLLTLEDKLKEIGGYEKSGGEVVEGLVDKAIENYVRTYVKENSNREDLDDATLDQIMKLGEDIGMFEFGTYDLSTSRDTLLALMDKVFKAKQQEVLDKIANREYRIRQSASALAKLSPGNDQNEFYNYMLEFDEEGVPTAMVVQKIGQQYWNKKKAFYDKLSDASGTPLQYRHIDSIEEAKKTKQGREDIAYNIALHKRKMEFAIFMRAEYTQDGTLRDGRYHRYNDEFKKARLAHETYVQVGENHGHWEQKKGISDAVYQKYLVKYYDQKDNVTKSEYIGGEFTGRVYDVPTRFYVKKDYVVINETAKNDKGGLESMVSEKWDKIMNPTDALGEAQKEFYNTYMEIYNDMLEKLPMTTRDKMLGKMPLIKNTFFESLKDKPNVVANMWTKMTRGTKDFFTSTAHSRRVVLDEQGNLTDQLPIFYVGSPRTEEQLKKILDDIEALETRYKEGGSNAISFEDYKKELEILKGEEAKIRQVPTRSEISKDMADSLLRFTAMAENYEVMGQAEDTINAMLKIIERRTYSTSDNIVTAYVKGKKERVGEVKGTDSNVYKRAKKWMSMVYYNNDSMSKSVADKMVSKIIRYSSLSYVAWNPFGNINNYVIARLNNGVEVAGQRFFSAKSYARATAEFNKRVMPDLARKTAFAGGQFASGQYDQYEAQSKYEAFVELFRMMDNTADIRESGYSGKKGLFSKLMDLGYLLQDGAEYNVQTKVGMAMIMDVQVRRSEDGNGGETLSLWDAMEFNSVTHKLTLKEGFNEVAERNSADPKSGERTWKKYNDQWRYQYRNKIREVNKQIHGNYAHEDRMVIQSHWGGELIAQFHKWVVPAIKARYRKEYFDENVGWLEGRYRTLFQLTKWAWKNKANMRNLKEQFKQDFGEGNRAKMKVLNLWRAGGEMAIMFTTLALASLLKGLWEDDDDDSPTMRRLKNATVYQADRAYKELIQFAWFTPDGVKQIWQMVGSPIASTRTLGELTEAFVSTVDYAYYGLTQPPEEFYKNSDVYYQRRPRKGQLKMAKEWKDAVPIIYGIQRWADFENQKDFYIK